MQPVNNQLHALRTVAGVVPANIVACLWRVGAPHSQRHLPVPTHWTLVAWRESDQQDRPVGRMVEIGSSFACHVCVSIQTGCTRVCGCPRHCNRPSRKSSETSLHFPHSSNHPYLLVPLCLPLGSGGSMWTARAAPKLENSAGGCFNPAEMLPHVED